MRLRIAPSAEADLDEIWLYLVQETGNLVLATEIVDSITDKFSLLTSFHSWVEAVKPIWEVTGAASLWTITSSFTASGTEKSKSCVSCMVAGTPRKYSVKSEG
jgi:hypothetical protein